VTRASTSLPASRPLLLHLVQDLAHFGGQLFLLVFAEQVLEQGTRSLCRRTTGWFAVQPRAGFLGSGHEKRQFVRFRQAR
jgi:hypothetical protein